MPSERFPPPVRSLTSLKEIMCRIFCGGNTNHNGHIAITEHDVVKLMLQVEAYYGSFVNMHYLTVRKRMPGGDTVPLCNYWLSLIDL